MTAVFLYCRSGFENEAAIEITKHCESLNIHGFVRAKPGTGWIIFEAPGTDLTQHTLERLAFNTLIFIRQWFLLTATLKNVSAADRVTPIVAALGANGAPYSDVFLETPDTNDGKELSPLCRALTHPLSARLQSAGLMQPGATQRAHVCLLDAGTIYVGAAEIANSSPWPGGVPRLKFPRAAPSRSTLKLDEAWLTFLTTKQQSQWLQPGMTAVDLGAAPGGWTYQLVRRHIHVTAVDNAAMAPALLDSGLVEHVRADGFRYQPPKQVDWMVCDMVEQPMRIAQLAARWIAQDWCHYTIFNLKLPMKKRYEETQRCLNAVRTTLAEAGVRYVLACKQMYHDREEVTVYVGRK